MFEAIFCSGLEHSLQSQNSQVRVLARLCTNDVTLGKWIDFSCFGFLNWSEKDSVMIFAENCVQHYMAII